MEVSRYFFVAEERCIHGYHDAGYDVHTAVIKRQDAFADTAIVLLAVHYTWMAVKRNV